VHLATRKVLSRRLWMRTDIRTSGLWGVVDGDVGLVVIFEISLKVSDEQNVEV